MRSKFLPASSEFLLLTEFRPLSPAVPSGSLLAGICDGTSLDRPDRHRVCPATGAPYNAGQGGSIETVAEEGHQAAQQKCDDTHRYWRIDRHMPGGIRMSDPSAAVASQYGRGGLTQRLLAALAAAGKDIDHLTIEDLAPLDEFHSRRRRATEELARMLQPTAADRVIDVGSGLGGPARYLAATYSCRVSGVDLTAEFVATATELTRRTGLADRVDFRQGSGLALPFPDRSFDLAWTQNVAMNIADRPRWYAELHRVLKRGGRLAIQDVTQGPGGPLHYPVNWADHAAISFLRTPEETRALLEAAGFEVLAWEDNSDIAMAEAEAERGGGRQPLGVHLVVGESFREKMQNSRRNMRENRTRLINAVLRSKPG